MLDLPVVVVGGVPHQAKHLTKQREDKIILSAAVVRSRRRSPELIARTGSATRVAGSAPFYISGPAPTPNPAPTLKHVIFSKKQLPIIVTVLITYR